MRYSRSSYRYAKALIGLAQEESVLDRVHEDMVLIRDSYSENSELRSVFDSSVIKIDSKRKIATNVFSKKVHEISLNFILLIVDKMRSSQMVEITSRFLHLYNEFKSLSVATVTTAIPLGKELKQAILEKVAKIWGKTVEVENIVDESVIGGFILKIGDLQYNVSISNKIKNMRKEFDNNLYLCNY